MSENIFFQTVIFLLIFMVCLVSYATYKSSEAYNKGYKEAAINMPYSLNPYSNQQFARSWMRGYKDYQRDQILQNQNIED